MEQTPREEPKNIIYGVDFGSKKSEEMDPVTLHQKYLELIELLKDTPLDEVLYKKIKKAYDTLSDHNIRKEIYESNESSWSSRPEYFRFLSEKYFPETKASDNT